MKTGWCRIGVCRPSFTGACERRGPDLQAVRCLGDGAAERGELGRERGQPVGLVAADVGDPGQPPPYNVDKAKVNLQADRLICEQCGRAYPVRDGIPIMLEEEAEFAKK